MLAVMGHSAGVFLTAAVLTTASSAFAQTPDTPGVAVIGGFGWAVHVEDDSFLGRGPLLSGGVSVPLGSWLAAEGEVAWGTFYRDVGTLVTDGTAVVATGRLVLKFRGSRARARPFLSGGLAVGRWAGQSTARHLVPGPDGRAAPGPEIRQDWSTTQTAWEIVGAGVDVATAGRLSWRPEVRWIVNRTDRPFTPGPRVAPIWFFRGGVTVGWRMR